MLLSQRNLKTYIFSQKVAVFTRNRTHKQLWQKSRFRFDCKKNTTFCEHHKSNNLLVESSAKWSTKSIIFLLKIFAGTPNWSKLFLRKHHSGVVSNQEHIPQMQQNENETAYDCKTKWKLKWATNKFSNQQNHEKSYSKTTFRYIHTYPSLSANYSLTEINRTPWVFYNNFKTKQTLNPTFANK